MNASGWRNGTRWGWLGAASLALCSCAHAPHASMVGGHVGGKPVAALADCGGQPCPPAAPMGPMMAPAPGPAPWLKDEYLGQGGDRKGKVYIDPDGTAFGLDTEDTVAQFNDGTGEQHVVASNRLNIYSPRFGAVRSVWDAQGIQNRATGDEVHNLVGAEFAAQQEMPLAGLDVAGPETARSTRRASGITGEFNAGAVILDERAAQTIARKQAVEAAGTQQGHEYEHGIGAEEDRRVAGPLTWGGEQFPNAIVSPGAGNEVVTDRKPQEVLRVLHPTPASGAIRIVKSASTDQAVAGEEIEFRIAYENVGGRPLESVLIVDNLTPRLQYVEGSQTCDRPSGFSAMENVEGSSTLRWTLREPLPPKAKGQATFRAKVR